ncbi:hypothetical protein [Botrimarina hoheduenensis]|uniref:Bacterial type II/III secretion system short domain protein n=1 Tax=Botrimarina hoheduenensis TaxID=2528000 RepID=A0A5C5VVX4_9BACT|nr:hypothetical protein [Botrimarina hoheduenensis]TWT42510.1 hypothetical protein Pla111_28150 [Botrimarina hoheduenensis]
MDRPKCLPTGRHPFGRLSVTAVCCLLRVAFGAALVSSASAQSADWANTAPAANRYGQPAAPAAGASRYSQSPETAAASRPGFGSLTGTPAQEAPSQLTPVAGSRAPLGGYSAGESQAKVSKGSGKLPNDAGQVWREYDIRPYTLRVGDQPRPQQAIVDWILRETGYEAWHSETFGILNADREKLTVYHTPAMQGIVADIVDRFVNSRTSDRAFSMRIATVRNPDWRVKTLGLMSPVPVQSAGLQGWIMPKENYALLLAELGKRGDVREYNAANQVVPNGRSTTFNTMRPRSYVKGIVPTRSAWPGYQPETGQLEEGAVLEFNPLLSLNGDNAEAIIKLRLQQIEKMCPVTLDLPAPVTAAGVNNSGQRVQIEVPQMTMANLHERFRWPSNQVLLLSMGMVAPPAPEAGNALEEMLPMFKSPSRADALLVIEVRDSAAPAAPAGSAASTASRIPATFNGRY